MANAAGSKKLFYELHRGYAGNGSNRQPCPFPEFSEIVSLMIFDERHAVQMPCGWGGSWAVFCQQHARYVVLDDGCVLGLFAGDGLR
jgi:hypothetical protein